MSSSASPNAVTLTQRYRLQCADEGVIQGLPLPFELGPLDHMVFRGVPIDVVFVYKTTTSEASPDDQLIPIAHLRQAICRLLDYYPHLTGRLHFDAKSNTPQIVALNTGAELIEAHCDQRLDDVASTTSSGRILITNLPDSGAALVAHFDPTIEGVSRDPIFTVQHTRFSCGGVALGIRLHHIVCDAQGFFNLTSDLAEIYRVFRSGSPATLSQPPRIQSILRGPDALSDEQRRAALEYQPDVYFTKDDQRLLQESVGLEDSAPAADHEIVGRVLSFSADDLAALKMKATDPSGKGWVSTTESLSAYLCQRVYQARLEVHRSQAKAANSAGPELLPGFWISIDMRAPDRLNQHPRYFPNCIYAPYTNTLNPSIIDAPLHEIAKSVHNLIRAVDTERMKKTTEWVEAQPDKGAIRVGFAFGKGSFTVSQWCKMNMYEGKHFETTGNGQPVLPALVSPAFTKISLVDGLAMLLASEPSTEQPAVNVNLSIIKPVWDILDKDEEFRQYYA